MLSSVLLVLFLFCGLVFARASKRLNALDKLRLDKDYPNAPQAMLNFTRKMGIPTSPVSDELRTFCEREGLTADYKWANGLLLGSAIAAVIFAVVIIRLGPGTPPQVASKPGAQPSTTEAAPKPKP